MGITKAVLAAPEIAAVLLKAGVSSLGDSRIENVKTLSRAKLNAPKILIRSPMLSQVDQVVADADISFNTEIDVIRALSDAALKIDKMHGVVLVIELGDLREGIMPRDVDAIVRETLRCKNILLRGIATNLACLSGVAPDAKNMAKLSQMANSIEASAGSRMRIVSGGNSANLNWALSGADTGRINNLRLGESLLLGRETLRRKPIPGLQTDAFTLVAEVIESKIKPSQPWGAIGQSAFEDRPPTTRTGNRAQAILAIGRQDIDPFGLYPPPGIEILGASSDHLVVDSGDSRLAVGDKVKFNVNYSALVRAMTSTFVTKVMKQKAATIDKPCVGSGKPAVPVT